MALNNIRDNRTISGAIKSSEGVWLAMATMLLLNKSLPLSTSLRMTFQYETGRSAYLFMMLAKNTKLVLTAIHQSNAKLANLLSMFLNRCAGSAN